VWGVHSFLLVQLDEIRVTRCDVGVAFILLADMEISMMIES